MTTLDIHLNPPQAKAHRLIAPGQSVCLAFGRGVGKSWFQRQTAYEWIARYDGEPRKYRGRDGTIQAHPTLRGVRIILVAPTWKQAVDIHGQALRDELTDPDRWAFLGGKINRSTWRVEFPGGSTLQLFGAENINAIRGIRCDIILPEECDDISPSVYDAVAGPWLNEPWSLGIQVFAGTPRRGRNGLLFRQYERGLDGTRPDHHTIHATCYDAVGYSVGAEYIARRKRDVPPEVFAREDMCDFDAAEGLVYPGFFSGFHVREPDPGTKWNGYILGVDWGFADPAVMLVIGLAGSGRDVTAHVLDEVYVTGHTDSQLAEYAKRIEALYPGALWYADPSRPQSIESLRREAKIRVRGAENPIEDGVALVADMLLVRRVDGAKTPREWAQLYVAPNCVNAIREFGLYRRKRDRKNPERSTDEIEDRDNHAMDALRYALFSHFGHDRRIVAGYGTS